ncbi:MAG TPA: CehA/McbA family metallohydrolase [Dictyoglomaceae bacterium]|nr:CehA/McbA family metallohydrolase [Dictyoglomaceae bacterium]
MGNEYHYNIELYPEDSRKLIPIELEIPEGTKEIIIKAKLEPEYLTYEESRKPIIEAIKKYISQGFEPLDIKDVPQGILENVIRSFSPLKNVVNFRLIDAEGSFRGTGDQRFTKGMPIKIGEKESTLGCVAGDIPAGNWKLILEVKSILKKSLLNIIVSVNREEKTKISDVTFPYTPVLSEYEEKSGWVKGDFHLHSNHSDGVFSIENLIKFNIRRGLDFIFLTDHNKISGYQMVKEENYPIWGGMEFTTFWGHFLGLGIYDYIPLDLINPEDGIKKVSEKVHFQGGIFCIAHPNTIGYPICPGCKCELPIDWRYVDAIEVWSGSFNLRSFEITESIKQWRNLLKEHYRITAIGSSDMHKAEDITEDVPINYVYVEELNLENLINAVKMGRLYITSGPKVEFSINNKMIGDIVNKEEALILKYSCEEECDLKIIYNGEEYIKIPSTQKGIIQIRLEDEGYIYLEFWKGKNLKAITNPIYIK